MPATADVLDYIGALHHKIKQLRAEKEQALKAAATQKRRNHDLKVEAESIRTELKRMADVVFDYETKAKLDKAQIDSLQAVGDALMHNGADENRECNDDTVPEGFTAGVSDVPEWLTGTEKGALNPALSSFPAHLVLAADSPMASIQALKIKACRR